MNARHGLIWSAVALGLVLAVLVVVASRDVVRATFNPTLSASVSDSAAGANADIATDFNVPAGDNNYASTVSFTPSEFFVAADADITDGAYAGTLYAVTTLGLLNNPCTNSLDVPFDLYDATTDTSNTISWADSFLDSDGNGLLDGIEKYPDFLNTLFPGITPRARLFGYSTPAATNQTMNFVLFEPGTALPGMPAFDASWGYPSVSVLSDPTAGTEPGAITDFCSPLATTTTNFGLTKDNPDTAADESGEVNRANPDVGGEYTFTIFARSLIDADGDGYDTQIDTCPLDVNEGDPIAGTGDDDSDGIDNVCDPDQETLTDTDSDGYMNRGDNCPLVANGPNEDNQADADADTIGDACDPNPNTMDGAPEEQTLTFAVTIEGGEETPEATPEATATAEATPEATAEATPEATPEATATATPEATATATPEPTPTPVPEVGGGGLLGSDDDGLPVWTLFVIGIAAVLLIGSVGTMVTVARRRQ